MTEDYSGSWLAIEDPVYDTALIDVDQMSSLVDRAISRCVRNNIPEKVYPISEEIGRETGDDRILLSENPLSIAIEQETAQSILKLEVSEDDTFISNQYWNYCSHTDTIPKGEFNSWRFVQRDHENDDLDYNDNAPLRAIIDCRSNDRESVKSSLGKSRLLSVLLTRPNRNSKFRLELANLLQDACLRTWRSPDPKYLPVSLGGSGSPPPFGLKENLYMYVSTYRGGTCRRLYGTATEEAMSAVELMDQDRWREISTPLSNHLRKNQKFFNAEFGGMLVIPDFHNEEPLPKPLYSGGHHSPMVNSVEARLRRARLIITREEAKIEMMKSVKAHDLLLGHKNVAEYTREARERLLESSKRYRNKTFANTFYAELLNGIERPDNIASLLSQGFSLTSSQIKTFSVEQAAFITNGCLSRNKQFSLLDLPKDGDVFIRGEVSSDESYMVGGIPLTPIWSKQPYQVTTTKVGLYEISKPMETWAAEKLASLKKVRDSKESVPNLLDILPIVSTDTEWVKDDHAVYEIACIEAKSLPMNWRFLIVTTDIKLCKRVANNTQREVLVLPPDKMSHYISYTDIMKDGITQIPVVERLLKETLAIERVRVIVDQGSCHAHLQYQVWQESKKNRILLTRKPISSSIDGGWRTCVYKRIEIDKPPVRALIKTIRPISMDKARVEERVKVSLKSLTGTGLT